MNVIARYVIAFLISSVAFGCVGSTHHLRTHVPDHPSNYGAFFALSVKDLDPMVAWYRDILGFAIFNEGQAPDRPIRFALLKSSDALIELLQLPDAKPRAEAAPGTNSSHQIHGFFKGGFVVPEIDAEYQRLKKLDVVFAYELGKPPNGPYRSFGIRDPEGNLLQFFGR